MTKSVVQNSAQNSYFDYHPFELVSKSFTVGSSDEIYYICKTKEQTYCNVGSR